MLTKFEQFWTAFGLFVVGCILFIGVAAIIVIAGLILGIYDL